MVVGETRRAGGWTCCYKGDNGLLFSYVSDEVDVFAFEGFNALLLLCEELAFKFDIVLSLDQIVL